jgi:ParB family chromosome partitioning protein
MAPKTKKSSSTKIPVSDPVLNSAQSDTPKEEDLVDSDSENADNLPDFEAKSVQTQNQSEPVSLTQENKDTGYEIRSIPIDSVDPDPDQPRKYFDPEDLDQLKKAIQSTNFIEPILVRENDQKNGSFFIVDGERRWRACKELNHSQIFCQILPVGSLDYEIVAFSQNVHRADLTIMEKAVALGKLRNRMKEKDPISQQKALISIVHLSEGYISDLIKINKIDDSIKNEVLNSSSWTRAKLLQIAKNKNSEKQFGKFKELKAAIPSKTTKISEAGDTTTSDSYTGKAPDDKNTQNSEFDRFRKLVGTFVSRLENVKVTKLKTSDIETIKPDLDKIIALISNIVPNNN